MNLKRITSRITGRFARWLKTYKTSILLAGVIFFILMYLDLPGFRTTDMEKVFGSIVLALGLINFTYWTLINRKASQVQEKRKIKGRRKS
ncbi:hypothetical protein [Methanocella sp. MCL-LM]|uniref:hypothetical protein n=1 Tax=Methanocella sp. MCL-LM TaxID=3412035 RepID=UPI003C743A54